MRAFLGIAGVLCVCCVLFVGTAYASDAEELQPDNADAARQSDVGEVTVSAVPSDSPDVVEKVTEPQGDTSVSSTSPEVSPYVDSNDPESTGVVEGPLLTKANPTYWDVWHDVNTFFPNSWGITADDGTVVYNANLSAQTYFTQLYVMVDGHSILLPRGFLQRIYNRTISIGSNVESMQSDVTAVKSDVATIKQQLPNTGSGLTSAQWTELTNDLRTQNTLLLVLVCVLAAVLGSNVAPMLVKGWRR